MQYDPRMARHNEAAMCWEVAVNPDESILVVGMQAGLHICACLAEAPAIARALKGNLHLMACAHLGGSLSDLQKELRSRSRAFALLPSTISLSDAMTAVTDRAGMSLLPPCTKKQQRYQEKYADLALAYMCGAVSILTMFFDRSSLTACTSLHAYRCVMEKI